MGLITSRILWAIATSLWICASVVGAQEPPTAAPPPTRFVVVLDAAHGGDDPGGQLGNGQTEKAFTLAMAVRLRSLLLARGIPVIMTRDSDNSIDPNRRAEIANRARAQACIVLHGSESGYGVHLFASSLAPAPAVRFPAWKTAQAGFVNRSLALTGIFNSALQHAGTSVTLARTSLPGLDSLACPALAVEVAPDRAPGQGHPADLDDPAYQAHIAETLAAAILQARSEAHQQ